MITIVEQQGLETYQIGLDVEQDGWDIIVRPGTFIAEEEYTLADDWVYTAAVQSEEVEVQGVLVEVLADGSAAVLIHEYLSDGVSYVFRGSPYRLLAVLFRCAIAADVVSMDDVEIRVYRRTWSAPPDDPEQGDE